MSKTSGGKDERLEAILRRWGADESVRQAHPSPPRGGAVAESAPSALRWMPVALGVVLFAGALALFIYSKDQGGRGAAAAASEKTRADGLSQKLAGAERDLGQERGISAELKKDNESAARKTADLEGQLAKTKGELGDAAKKSDDALAALRKQLAEAVGPVEVALADARKQVAALTQSVDDERGKTRAAETAATKASDLLELEKICEALGRAQFDQARTAAEAAAEKKTAVAAAAAAERESAVRDAARRVYMASRASGETGLRGQQAAARNARLLARAGEVRKQAKTDAARKVVDSLEVLLTRLDLLDASKKEGADTFAALAAQADVAGQASKVFNGEEPFVREWLLEAEFVLTGG